MKNSMALIIAAALLLLATASIAYSEEEAWKGVDETVVEKYADEHGRSATGSLVNVEGDALLFAFLMAGVAGGFVLGYFYRDVVKRKPEEKEIKNGARKGVHAG